MNLKTKPLVKNVKLHYILIILQGLIDNEEGKSLTKNPVHN